MKFMKKIQEIIDFSYPWLDVSKTKKVKCCLCNGEGGVEIVFSFFVNNKKLCMM